ncbi:hydroxyectoine utilization dehydratase EutB [Mesorhizobium sp. M0923]|uniref:hydroxyectoine utilization dehydratase EutB n=1 Tax=Mesorhizobium sp. M0923 TaxID=2957028 RepID=UPI003335116E
MTVTLQDIQDAQGRISEVVHKTPTVASPSLTEVAGVPVFLKLEHHQFTGSFKLRGATNALRRIVNSTSIRGVVAASTGNHGRALAVAARSVGLPATIFMSQLVPENKVLEIRRLGADVRIVGTSHDEAQDAAECLQHEEKLTMIPPFDHPDVVAGQGTIGLELAQSIPEVGTVVVPVSGGGLAAGIALAVKALRPHVRVIGVTMDQGAAMKASIDAGMPVQVKEVATLADSLGGGIGLENQITFAMCSLLLDNIVLLTEEEIASGIKHAYENEREILEGAGAVSIGFILAQKVSYLKGPIALILSGRNIDMTLHRRIIGRDGSTDLDFGGRPR